VDFSPVDVEHIGAQAVERPALGVLLQDQIDAMWF
jgi:hypothetical protein